MGLVEFDFLGLKTLAVLDIAVKLIDARPDFKRVRLSRGSRTSTTLPANEVSVTGKYDSGGGSFFVTAHHAYTCAGGKPGLGDDDTVVTALSFVWPKK